MIETGIGGEFTVARASGDHEFLAESAMGKIPWLETEWGGIAETVAILEYFEEATGGGRLYPGSLFERAKIRQIVNVVQVYLEVPLRRLYPAVFMGGCIDKAAVAETMSIVSRGSAALDRLCSFAPFVRGADLSAADLVLFFTLELGERVARHACRMSMFDGRARLLEWDEMMRGRDSTKQVLADFAVPFAEYCRDRNAAWDEANYQAERFSNA